MVEIFAGAGVFFFVLSFFFFVLLTEVTFEEVRIAAEQLSCDVSN